MDISFIYIDDYKNIKKQSFNLDAGYHFTFDPAIHKITYTLNTNYIPNYYSPKQENNKSVISNVTAIVGQNGSGKSTFLEFMGRAFRGWNNSQPAFSFVKDLCIGRIGAEVVILYGQTSVIKKIEGYKGEWVLNPKSLEPIPQANHLFPRTNQNNVELKKRILPIYYSTSMFDRLHDTGVQEWDIANVSNAYMYYATNIPIQNDRLRGTRYKRLKHPSNFKFEDHLRQIIFIQENEKWKYLPKLFNTYDYFSLSIRQVQSSENSFKQIFVELFKKFRPTADIEFLRLQFLTAVIHGLVFPGKNHIPPGTKESYFEELKSLLSQVNDLKSLIMSFLNNHQLRDSKQITEFWERKLIMYDFRVPEKEKLVEYLFESFTNKNFKDLSNGALENFLQNLGEKEGEEIDVQRVFFNPYKYDFRLKQGRVLCELYLNQLEDLTPDFIEISFDLSSGEGAFVNLFSRFYFAFADHKMRIQFDSPAHISKFYSGILIMIDEAEAFFNPQWQKEYLSLLVSFFENLFEGISVQLVIASNSPFITADIPTYNVIFLEPNEKGLCSVSTRTHTPTLGANIYQLFKDAFYLKNGYGGEFAKHKTNEILGYLNYSKANFSKLSPEIRLYIQQFIKNVGEPALANKLQEMFEEQMSNDKNSLR